MLDNCPAGIPADKVTEHVSTAPAAEGMVPQLTKEMPDTAVTAVATAPAGKRSLTVSDVPEMVPPLLPSARLYSIVPPVRAVALPDLDNVKFAGVLTVVVALPQLASEQLPLDGGSDGVPPAGPTVA